MKTPEGSEKDKVRAYLKAIGAYVFSPVQGGWGTQSVDFLACIHGIFWAIEVKRPKAGKPNEPTKRQGMVLADVDYAGGMTVWGTAETIIARIKQWQETSSPIAYRGPDLNKGRTVSGDTI